MNIYEYLFGVPYGQVQVNCCFHDDTKASAGISPTGQYNCFACGAKANNEITFIKKYFNVNDVRANIIKTRLETLDKYKPTEHPLQPEQYNYLKSIGLSDEVITKYFICQSNGKLIYKHTWNGLFLGTTWFNSPTLSNYNAGAEKYKYQGIVGGMCTPYDAVQLYGTLLITEGEKDMLTAQSLGIKCAVAKLGGAKTPIIGGINFDNKKVVIVYDCDIYGREGAIADACYLKENHNCSVKVVDLQLQDKEDLNDYFMKYGKTVQDLYKLIQATPEFVVPATYKMTKIDRLLNSLSQNEIQELKEKLKNE